MTGELKDLAYVAATDSEAAYSNFFTAASRLHLCAVRLFEDTPYDASRWPELWFYEASLVRPYVSEEAYANLLNKKADPLVGHALPQRFQDRLDKFRMEFEAELPGAFQAIADLRPHIPVKRKNNAYSMKDVSDHFAPHIIIRPHQEPFPNYDIGVGLLDTNGSSKKATKNGRGTRRDQEFSTELVLMISLMMNLHREDVFLYLFPYDWKNNVREEWECLRFMEKSYLFSLYEFCSLEAIFDDLLVLFGCYELFITTGMIKRDSERLIVMLASFSRQALTHRRFWERVRALVGEDGEEALLRHATRLLLPPKLQSGSRLLNIFMRDMQALNSSDYSHIEKSTPEMGFSGFCGYPRLVPQAL